MLMLMMDLGERASSEWGGVCLSCYWGRGWREVLEGEWVLGLWLGDGSGTAMRDGEFCSKMRLLLRVFLGLIS
jgi:hypothetical protein